ncbi:C2 domain-containing protein [Aureococcus anophagefferens]|nr:C2 domain-containing protein [Aureococcus anophagefferens]
MADDDECVELAVEEDDEEIDMTQYVEEARREKKRMSLEDRAKAALAGPRDLKELDADFLASYEGETLHPTAPPNFLRVGLHSARNLKAVDSQLFGSEKWSDPQVRFVVKAGKTRGELSATSRVVERELNPTWKQPFVFAASPDPDWALELRAVVEDHDQIGSHDFLGEVAVTVKPHDLAGGRWAKLGDPRGELGDGAQGELLFVYRWVYDWSRDAETWDPFPGDDQALLQERPRNELRVAVHRARGLAAVDKALLSKEPKSSDPFARVNVAGGDEKTRGETSHREDALNPKLEVVVLDHDAVGSHDVMGKLVVPLAQFDDREDHRRWFALGPAGVKGEKADDVTGDVELVIKWWYNPAIDPNHKAGRNESLLSYLTPDFIEDAVDSVMTDLESSFYTASNMLVLAADLTIVATEWKRAVEAMSVVVGMVPTITDAISEAGKIVSIMYKTLMAASCNPFALGNVLYSGYDVLTNTDSLPLLYKTSGKLVTSMMTIEHFVTTVMDVIVRGWDLYQTHFAKMEQKEASEAKQRAAARGEAYDFDPFGSPTPTRRRATPCCRTRSTVKYKNLDPQWNEIFSFDLQADESDESDGDEDFPDDPAGEREPQRLVVRLLDYDVSGDADDLGHCAVDLAPLRDRKRTKKWYALKKTPAYADASDGYFDDDDPLAPISGDAVGFPDQKPNCLKIGVFRAKDLSRVDRASSDPRARFEVEGRANCRATSTPVWKSNLQPDFNTTCPVWKEIYAMRLTGKNPMLTCFVEDWDAVGRADPMGSFRVELGPYADRKPKKKWFALSGTRDDGTSFSGQVLLWLQWTYDPHPPKKERETCYDALLECLGQDAGATAQLASGLGAAAEDGGAPPAAEGAAAPSVKLPKSDAVRSQSKGVMGGVLDGVRGAIADVGNVVKLAGDLGHLHSNFDEAIESLAYVEHCVPKIVSALEMLQSVVQVILKAVQGVAFPPNPAVIVDLMHTSRRVMKQAASVVDVYDSQADLAKSVGILSKFALKLVDSIARTAALLKNAPSLGCCDSCVACCSSMSGATATGSRLAGV